MAKMAKGSILKIAIIGPESTGKTTLCQQLASCFNTVWVPEYAREFFNQKNITACLLNDLETIAHKQLQLEDELLKQARRFLFCDTNLITLKIWAQLEFGKVPAFIEEQIKKRHYDFYLISNNEVAWEADTQRQNKFDREKILELNVAEVEKVGPPYMIISGKGVERLSGVVERLRAFVD